MKASRFSLRQTEAPVQCFGLKITPELANKIGAIAQLGKSRPEGTRGSGTGITLIQRGPKTFCLKVGDVEASLQYVAERADHVEVYRSELSADTSTRDPSVGIDDPEQPLATVGCVTAKLIARQSVNEATQGRFAAASQVEHASLRRPCAIKTVEALCREVPNREFRLRQQSYS